VGENLSAVELDHHFETLVEDLQREQIPTALFILNPLLHTHMALGKVVLNGKHFQTTVYLGNVTQVSPWLKQNTLVL
jgi:hypothetical protein